MKRFWSRAEADGLQVRLDGRVLRGENGAGLMFGTPSVAAAVAEEWDRVQGEVRRDTLILTQLAATARRIESDSGPTIAALARYAETDLLCYRAGDPALASRQAEHWQPWLDWAREHHGAPLTVAQGVAPVAQPAESVAALRRALDSLDADTLAVLGVLVPAFGSLVLGLAVVEGALPAADAFAAAVLDEVFQEERWGADAEAAARRRALHTEVEEAVRYLALSRP